jgi:cyclomaltodextrinase
MEEFIFGTLATDELKLMHHRASSRGLQHQHNLSPRDPEPDQPITITAYVGINLTADHVACYYTTDNTEPQGDRGRAVNGTVLLLQLDTTEWDTASWGYLVCWKGILPPQPEGTMLRYHIGAWSDDGDEVYADWPLVKAASELAAAAFFRGQPVVDVMIGDPHQPHTFTASVDRLTPPAWAREAVIYHLFVDRFYPGDGHDWLQTADLMGFCGGTLWGVRDKLDYIVDLGITCIWLSPTFVTPTHHGYDVTDYFHVEPRLGGDEALHALVEAAHALGIRVLLDVAFNHLSNQHPYFLDALADLTSLYRDWFYFDQSEIGYRTFFGVETMPQLNVTNPAAREWLLDVGRYWLREFNVDGYRLDVADGPGPSFWTDFWLACKSVKPDCLCFGEVVDAPDVQHQYMGRMDGLLDFHLGAALRYTYGTGRWNQTEFDRFYQRHILYYPDNFLMFSFLDNHDMDRFLSIAGGDKEALRRATLAQFDMPRVPVIFYGTEVGLNQVGSISEGSGFHVSRVPMPWDDTQDTDLLTFFKELIKKRRALP